MAHSHSQSIATYGTTADGILERYQTFTFTMSTPGPDPGRQALPHPHQAILDPTTRFIVIPDLGADVVRFFSFENGVDSLTEHEPLVVAPGSGPRHVAFWSPDGEESTVFMYVLAELASEVTAYRVDYLEDGGLGFEQVFNISSVEGGTVQQGSMAAEIIVSVSRARLKIPACANGFCSRTTNS
jgi:6-phosphogluconolactonase (cycloisomerase 2 family)